MVPAAIHMSVGVLYRQPLVADAFVDFVGKCTVDGFGIEWLLIRIPGDGAVTADVGLACETPALVKQISETVTLAFAWRTEVFATCFNLYAISSTVSRCASVGNATFVANGYTEQIDVVAIRKFNGAIRGREANDGHADP